MRVFKVNAATRAIIEVVVIDDPDIIARLPFSKGEVEYLPEHREGPATFMSEYQRLVALEPVVEAVRVVVATIAEWLPLDELVAKKAGEIEIKRDQAIAGGIEWQAPGGAVHQVQTDKTAQDNMRDTASALALGNPWPADAVWRMADNTMVPMPAPSDFGSMYAAWLAHKHACWVKSWEKKAALVNLADPAQIAAFDATAGWPVNLGLA